MDNGWYEFSAMSSTLGQVLIFARKEGKEFCARCHLWDPYPKPVKTVTIRAQSLYECGVGFLNYVAEGYRREPSYRSRPLRPF